MTRNIGVDVAIDAVGFESEPTGPIISILAGMKQIGTGYIQQGRIRADDMITHEISLDRAREGYEKFGRHIDNCLKVVMHPTH